MSDTKLQETRGSVQGKRDCVHGRLARSCEICQLKAELARAQAELLCLAADTDNCVQSVTEAKIEVVRNTLTRLWSLLSTHRTMWDAAKGNMATLPSYDQCGLIMDDLQRCCDLLTKEPAPPLSQYVGDNLNAATEGKV